MAPTRLELLTARLEFAQDVLEARRRGMERATEKLGVAISAKRSSAEIARLSSDRDEATREWSVTGPRL